MKIVKEEDENESNAKCDDESNRVDTLVNKVMTEINSSLISSFKRNKSNDTFDDESNNMRLTKRLGDDSNYDIFYKKKNLSYDKQSMDNFQRKSSMELETKINGFHSVKFVPNPNSILQMPSEVNHNTQNVNNNPSEVIDINIKNLEEPLNSQGNMNLITKISPPENKILVVDDQVHARQALANLITKHCKKGLYFNIIEECDGIECLNTIIKNPFNIRYIFMDENMNFINGRETAEIIRRLTNSGKIGNIKMILTSGDDNISYKQNLFDFRVTKPLVLRNIQEILGHEDINILR